MIKVLCECLYCGYKWVGIFYDHQSMDAAKCEKCKDTTLKIAEYKPGTSDVFGYNK